LLHENAYKSQKNLINKIFLEKFIFKSKFVQIMNFMCYNTVESDLLKK